MLSDTPKKKWYKDIYNLYLIALAVLVIAPLIAPILLKLGLTFPAKYIYFIYSFTCHQFESRSLHVFDHQYAWCTRDTAIWLAVFVIALLVKLKKVKGINWYWVIPFAIPLAMDGIIQTVFTILDVDPVGINNGMPVYISNNFIRFVTGTFFGMGFSLWVSPTLKNDLFNVDKNQVILSTKRSLINISICFLALILAYVLMVGLWNVTSKTYKPANSLDSVVRTPKENFFVRRKNAVCPTTDKDMFNFGCFF